MKKFFVVIIVTLFFASPTMACTDYFCQMLEERAGVNLQIDQSYGSWSNRLFNTASNYSMAYQAVEANGYASPGASASFEAQAVQGNTYSNKHYVDGTDLAFSGFSFMETLASGETGKYCPVDLSSYAGQFTNANVMTFGTTGIATSLDMSTHAKVSAFGKNLSFSGKYEQGSSVFTQGRNGFTLSNGLTRVIINK